jgi:hypothetical protein
MDRTALGVTAHPRWTVIGMVKGILMNRDDLTDGQAFHVLVSTSQ